MSAVCVILCIWILRKYTSFAFKIVIFDFISLCDFVISFVISKEVYKISEVSDPSNFTLMVVGRAVLPYWSIHIYIQQKYITKYLVIVNVQVRRYAGITGVPQRLIYANSVLHGQVAKTEQQSLLVWHTPFLRRLFRVGICPPGKKLYLVLDLLMLPPANVETHDLIKVQFSGVSLTSAPNKTAVWLNQTLLTRPVQFRLLHKKDDCIECIVHSWRKRWFHYVRHVFSGGSKWGHTHPFSLLGMND